MKQSFAAVILGGTGQVGGAAVAELLATSECREVVMVTRKPIAARLRLRNVVLDTGAADFAEPGSAGWEASCLGLSVISISDFSVAQSPQR